MHTVDDTDSWAIKWFWAKPGRQILHGNLNIQGLSRLAISPLCSPKSRRSWIVSLDHPLGSSPCQNIQTSPQPGFLISAALREFTEFPLICQCFQFTMGFLRQLRWHSPVQHSHANAQATQQLMEVLGCERTGFKNLGALPIVQNHAKPSTYLRLAVSQHPPWMSSQNKSSDAIWVFSSAARIGI